MKTKFLSLGITLCSVLFFQQNDLQAKGNPDVQPMKKFEELIKFPEAGRVNNLDDRVSVAFNVNEEGKINIRSIKSEHEAFRKNIQQQLDTLSIEGLDTNQVYRIIFDFKLL